jgi:hypothetical protein
LSGTSYRNSTLRGLIEEGGVPKKSLDCALLVAISVIHRIDFLRTLNCRSVASFAIDAVRSAPHPAGFKVTTEKGLADPVNSNVMRRSKSAIRVSGE